MVIANKPWNFDEALLILKDPSVDNFGEDDLWFTCFWLQIHGLPVFAMTRTIGIFSDNQVGTILESDCDDRGFSFGRFLRVRIRFDVRTPVRRG